MANTYLTKTMSGGSATTTKFTFSAWVKRTGLNSSDGMQILSVSNEYIYLGFFSDSLRMEMHDSDNVRLRSNAKFRDTNAWYHVVFTFDSTQATASDRMKMWVNNEQITSFSAASYPSLNYGSYIGGNTQHTLGRRENDDSDYFDGIISHAHLTVGYTYTPSAFGSTDATTGEWKINTSPSVTYGNNGFFILKDGNSVTDQSGNSNNFTVGGGTLTKTEDNPSNVFATGNPLIGVHSNGNTLVPTFSNGNNTATATGSAWRVFKSTLSASSGKYYAEFKWISDSNTRYAYVGIYDEDDYANKTTGYPYMGDMANGYGYYSETGDYWNNASNTSFGNSFSSTGDGIQGVALDLDNSKLYFSSNGVWQGGGNPSNGTGGISITANKTYTFGIQLYSVGSIVYSANFGNGYFGTTAVSSAGTNASGIGIFEYDVPTGFTALSTKGLNL